MHSLLKPSLLAGLVLGLAACQSARPLYPTGIYKTSVAFRRQQPSLVGSDVGRAFLARKLYVRNPPGSGERRTKVPLDSAWGYVGANHEPYRIFQRDDYRVEQPDTLTIYSRVVRTGRTSTTFYYFSRGLDGPIEELSKKHLRHTFADNRRFLDLLEALKWHQSLLSFEQSRQGTRSFRVVALYRQALGLPAAPHQASLIRPK